MLLDVDGGRLFYTLTGRGEAVVLVHGSWGDHHNWDAVVPALSAGYAVVAYDRRGHSASTAAVEPTVHDHVADLAAIIDAVGLGPVHLVGNSYGAAIALRTAASHPSRLRSLTAHEPPLMRTVDPLGPLAGEVRRFEEGYARVGALLGSGRAEDAARTFVDEIAFGSGAWSRLPAATRETFVRNAPTFLAEIDDPDSLRLDFGMLSSFRGPVLLSQGDQSPRLFAPIVGKVAAALLQAVRHTFPGAGHVPHLTHPRSYVERLEAFLGSVAPSASVPLPG